MTDTLSSAITGQLRLAYNGSEESKIRLGADIDCDPEEYKPNYLTRLCPPIESDKTLDLAGYTLKKTGNSIDAQDHLLSVQYSKLTIEDSVGTRVRCISMPRM